MQRENSLSYLGLALKLGDGPQIEIWGYLPGYNSNLTSFFRIHIHIIYEHTLYLSIFMEHSVHFLALSNTFKYFFINFQGGFPYWLLTKYPNIKLRTSDISKELQSALYSD